MIFDAFRGCVPIQLPSLAIGARGHNHGHRMREAVAHGCIGLLPAAETIEPVGHVRQVIVADECRRQIGVAGYRHISFGAVQERIVFVGAFLFHQLPPLAALASDIDQRGLLAHDAREAVAIVAEAGGIADQEPFRILQQRVESIRILAPVGPRKDAAVRDHRSREVFIHKPMGQINSVAHPLVGNAAGEFLVQPEFEIQAGIEGAEGLGEQPAAPVGIFFAKLLHFGAAAPAGP